MYFYSQNRNLPPVAVSSGKRTVARIRLDKDIRPVTEFRANAAAILRQVQEGKRAVVLTQRGHSAAVLLDVSEYEAMVGELDSLRHRAPSPEIRPDPVVEAYKGGIDRTLIRENLKRPVAERLRRLGEMAKFRAELRAADKMVSTGAESAADESAVHGDRAESTDP